MVEGLIREVEVLGQKRVPLPLQINAGLMIRPRVRKRKKERARKRERDDKENIPGRRIQSPVSSVNDMQSLNNAHYLECQQKDVLINVPLNVILLFKSPVLTAQ
jgi:hypothetical protein